MEQHAMSRLIGAPPGYVGYEDIAPNLLPLSDLPSVQFDLPIGNPFSMKQSPIRPLK